MEFEERAADPLAGGLMQGYQCGQLWGAVLAAGVQVYRLLGPGPQAEAVAVIASQRIVESFRDRNKEINCRELTGIDLNNAQKQAMRMFIKMFVEGKVIRCFTMAASCAHVAFREINATLSENNILGPSAPVSCSAMLAQKMGLSDMHTVMAAGFAGGIGLSGDACGALGAAIWMNNLAWCKDHPEKSGYSNPNTKKIIKAFHEAAGSEILCRKISGQCSKTINDHAEFIKNGGCDKLLNILAHPQITKDV